ncbi:MAG: hypothetical protein QM621_12215 [Aeromicrobium sp.]|uniref:hypothetical protein n=1 Tax=Aeromicrobium sp. TaxID=1871063 RepID=UPI0039E4BEC9
MVSQESRTFTESYPGLISVESVYYSNMERYTQWMMDEGGFMSIPTVFMKVPESEVASLLAEVAAPTAYSLNFHDMEKGIGGTWKRECVVIAATDPALEC